MDAEGDRKMKKLATIIALCAIGCSKPLYWVKANSTEQDYNVDSYSCERDMRQSNFAIGVAGEYDARDFYGRCMVSKGWRLSGTPAQFAR